MLTSEAASQPQQSFGRPDLPVNPLLTTKVTMPARRSGLIDRPRLMESMGPGFCATRRLTVVVAPAGFGKTTLVREWCAAHAEAADVAWLSLDGGEDDPARFLAYLTEAVRAVYPAFGEGVLALLRSPQAPSLETLLTLFINDLSGLPRPLRVVLDDYHLISEPATHRAVGFLLDRLPSLTLHLVIATRVDPPLPLARLRARDEVVELRAADLRCRGDEAASFLQNATGMALEEKDVAALEERTEGWMAGLQLAALSLRHRSDPHAFIRAFTGSNRYIVDYLGEEVLRQQPERVQVFLRRTSILSRLSGPLCDAVLGDAAPGEGQATLEAMDAANLFLVALDEERRWYRYHHLFADMLQARLGQEAAAEMPDLHRRAARWYADEGMHGEAVHHALAARDFEAAADLMERGIEGLWRRGEARTQARWIAALPEEVLRSRPVLLINEARAAVVSADAARIHEHLEAAEAAMESGERHAPADPFPRGQALSLRGYAARLLGDDAAARTHAEAALALLPADAGLWRAVTNILLAGLYGQEGDTVRGEALLSESAGLCESAGDPQLVLIARTLQAQLCQERADLAAAASLCEQGLAFAARMGAGDLLPMAGFAYVGLGSIAYARGDLEGAERYCRLGLERGEAADSADVFLRGSKILGLVHLARGEVGEARACFDRLEAYARSRNAPPVQEAIDAVCARFRMDTGDFAAAEAWAAARCGKDDLNRPLIAGSSVFLCDVVRVTLARLRGLQGRHEEAEGYLEPAMALARAQGRGGALLECLLVSALCRDGAGDRDGALAAAGEALRLGAPGGYVRAYADAGPKLAPLLRQAVARGLAGTDAAHHAAVLAALPAPAPASEPAVVPAPPAFELPDPLTEREIEVLGLVAAGFSNQEIADRLFLSVGTVKRHVHNLYGKLGAGSRLEAVTLGREAGLLP